LARDWPGKVRTLTARLTTLPLGKSFGGMEKMKKNFVTVLVVLLMLSVVGPALAQEAAPSKVIQIYREEVKPGKTSAHEKVEMGWPRAFAKANSPTHYLAMTSVSGPTEAWYITGYPSLAAWEKDTQNNDSNATLSAETQRLSAQDGELLSNARSIVATYQPDMSYRANDINLGEMRYFYVTTVRIRPGTGYSEINKIVRAAHEKANVPEHWAIFQVNYGMPSGTFLIFQPLKSLADVDAFPQTHGQAYRDAIGEDGSKQLSELSKANVLSSETNIFAFAPKMSYPSAKMIAGDPAFWAPKPKAAAPAKAAAAKPAAKP
jgi:hypothetical protein